MDNINTKQLNFILSVAAYLCIANLANTAKSIDDVNTRGNNIATNTATNTPSNTLGSAAQFFVNKGLTKEQAAGIVGNLHQKSGMNPAIENEIGAFGLAQWLDERKLSLRRFAEAKGKPATDFNTQLEFIWEELQTTERAAYNELKKTTTTADAAVSFRRNFERPGEEEANDEARIRYANSAFNILSNSVKSNNSSIMSAGAQAAANGLVGNNTSSNIGNNTSSNIGNNLYTVSSLVANDPTIKGDELGAGRNHAGVDYTY